MSRRGWGEGSLYQRKDGKWVAAVAYVDEFGRRRHHYRTGTKAEAKAALPRLRDSSSPQATDVTLGDLLARWRDDVTVNLRSRTAEGYATIIRLHLEPDLGRIPLADISAPTIQRYINRKRLAPRTVGHILAALRTALAYGVRWGMIDRNVASMVAAPRVPQHEVVPLTVAQARTLIAGGDALYVLALTTGMRQGELLGLRWQDIDGDSLTVRSTLHKRDGAFELQAPKTPRSRRTIPLPALAVDALRSHRARQNATRLAAGRRWADNGLVFTTALGSPLERTTVTHRFHADLRALGLPQIRFHTLRHTAASLLLAEGVPMRAIADILGHATPTVTANVYAHLTGDALRDASDRLGATLARNG